MTQLKVRSDILPCVLSGEYKLPRIVCKAQEGLISVTGINRGRQTEKNGLGEIMT
jgi:hypothetical protein